MSESDPYHEAGGESVRIRDRDTGETVEAETLAAAERETVDLWRGEGR